MLLYICDAKLDKNCGPKCSNLILKAGTHVVNSNHNFKSEETTIYVID
jgi:hypothetical protein